MSVSKDPARGTYYVQCWYRDWTGKRCKKTKRGFKTKKAASAWEVDFLRQMEGTPDMTLNAFYDLYCKDMDKKLRNTTKLNKVDWQPLYGHLRQRLSPAFLNSTGLMYPSFECSLKLLYQCT